MKITKRQLRRVIRETILLVESDYPPELETALCPICAKDFWDAGDHFTMLDDTGNNWKNEEQGQTFEIIGPMKVLFFDSMGNNVGTGTAAEAIDMAPDGEDFDGDWDPAGMY